ncbi:hypothetical protein L7F22_000867, partial [Adiantum nelumboides]|nr:hypothetical protein [Adiantum nelumboides]
TPRHFLAIVNPLRVAFSLHLIPRVTCFQTFCVNFLIASPSPCPDRYLEPLLALSAGLFCPLLLA